MKAVLFCGQPYAFDIMQSIYQQLDKQGYETLWYFNKKVEQYFPFDKNKVQYTTTIDDLIKFKADVNFAPGNVIPHYIPGVKVQIFHGLAGEKSGHFHIRHYFDLYLTQGPYFTERFLQLKKKYKNFEVKETGWCKLDSLFTIEESIESKKPKGYKHILLYSPTFSPSLTSATKYKESIFELANNKDYFIYIKFHDKMDKLVAKEYQDFADSKDNVVVYQETNIKPLLQLSDLMISDTSSVVYEFLLLDKPVVTFNSTSKNIKWDDISNGEELNISVIKNLNEDPHKEDRKWFYENYHPYNDGHSATRMISAAEDYINEYGVPDKRKLPFLRRRKMYKLFGKPSKK